MSLVPPVVAVRWHLVCGVVAVAAIGCSKGDLANSDRQLSSGAESRSATADAADVSPPATAVKEWGVAAKEGVAAKPGLDKLHSSSMATGPGSSIAPTLLIRTGQVSIEVASLDDGIAKIRQLAQRMGGYIANSSMQGGTNAIRSATLEVKMPAARFDQSINGLQSIGTVESVNVTAQDVGEEFVDVNARLANDRRLEQRLLDLLAQRTGKLSDVLAVESELARVREEIERYQGRVQYLRNQAAVSTLTITVHERAPILDGSSIGHNPLAEAFKTAWRNFMGFVAGFIALLGVLVPAAVLVFLGWVVYKGVRRM